MTVPVAPVPRRAGRPSTLSHDLIVAEALDLLDEVGVQGFSINKLAKRLNVSAMSFYKYFVGVDALLQAISDRVFTLFPMPEPTAHWRDFLLAWLHAMAAHVRRYPVALKVIAWNGNMSAGWLRAWLPVLEIIATHAPESERRKVIAHWLSLSAVGVMNAWVNAPAATSQLPPDLLADLTPHQRDLVLSLYGGSPPSDDKAVLHHVFVNIVAGLERLFDAG